MVKFKDFSRPLSVFQVLLKADLIFKDFSSTFQACANPGQYLKCKDLLTGLSLVTDKSAIQGFS